MCFGVMRYVLRAGFHEPIEHRAFQGKFSDFTGTLSDLVTLLTTRIHAQHLTGQEEHWIDDPLELASSR